MDMDVFFKRVYIVAFRLTGEEQIAEEIASQVIVHTFKEMNENYKEKVKENMLHLTIIELLKAFINSQNSHCNDNLTGIQRAI